MRHLIDQRFQPFNFGPDVRVGHKFLIKKLPVNCGTVEIRCRFKVVVGLLGGARLVVRVVGDSYDNALAENVNGSYKNELIHTRTWNDVVDVEIATFEWVTWWNESRLHQSLGYRTPAEVEEEFWTGNPNHERMEIKANA
ncbi:integrase core domain-containing protein [Corynebacterium qintianiae]|uniref:integrase core domain-containing protein n=1 Tax=Corynebacterium qintianiae TaxID=2709392 RepID=UPI0013ECF28F